MENEKSNIVTVMALSLFWVNGMDARADGASVNVSEIKVGNSVTSGTTIVNNSGQTVYIYEYTILYYSIVIYKTRQTSGNEAWMGSPAIIDDGNNYNVQHDCKTGANDCYITPPPTPSPKPMTQSVPEHTHDWVEGVIYEATPISRQ